MAIVTFDEFATVVGERAAENLDEEQVTMVIELVQGEMEAIARRPLEIRTFTDEQYILNLVEGILPLRNSPVRSITQIKDVADNIIPVGTYAVHEWGLDFAGFSGIALDDPLIWSPTTVQFTWNQTSDITLVANGGYPTALWRITYVAGIDGPNEAALRSLLIRSVRRELVSFGEGPAAFYTTMKVEDYSWRKSERTEQTMVSAFTPGEVAVLESYRRKRYS